MRLYFIRLKRGTRGILLAALVLWIVCVTAGSDTATAAADALRSALPIHTLRWELGDWFSQEDGLSAATVMAIGESPLLLSARPAVAELVQQQELPAPEAEEEEEVIAAPVEETPLEVAPPEDTDNGVPARTLVPTSPEGYTLVGSCYISNTTDYSLSPQALQTPFAARLTGDAPQILIIHTHGSEAYTPCGTEEPVWSGNHRTTDSRYNVVNVGDVMAEVFAQAGISVLHDRTLYDYPSYSGAYDRSLAAIESYLAQYPSIQFVLDVHRDAIEDGEGNQYKVISAIEEGRTAAQVSLVIGTDGGGLSHPNWMENLKLAVAVQEQALSAYPTLMRPVLLRNSRYNQHATTGSLLVEIGAAGNSPEEAALAGKLFAACLTEVLEAAPAS